MRKFSKRKDEAEINMTPMLDIVFIMLIFFIVTASFTKEFGLEINKPPPSEDQPKD
ncbi:MAG: biopolymer transporter ExbD, partial [Alphaproteobacteria bacterium]